ncbi:Hypothetical predicted protein [Lecanosticta acicola]|uniref:Serine-rich protein n=1 Tax=Lecanosticta acicola TaxID=111012 RepID=A0AAI8YXA6_9PEZI|nr:Hypothetical predicted protein [Lecanosticta acicola]
MFLDPEPKRPKTSNSSRSSIASSSVASNSTGDVSGTSRRDMSSGFFASSRPIISPRDSQTTRRKALHQRSNSKNTEQLPSPILEQPTVRLVNPSPSPPHTRHAAADEEDGDSDEGAEAHRPQQNQQDQGARLPRSDRGEQASVSNPTISAASRDFDVSEPHYLAAAEEEGTLPPNDSQHELRTPRWHRRSTSSGTYSQSSTLQDSETAFSKKSTKSERYSSLSQLSTLLGTPTPYEQELRERVEADSLARGGPAHALETLQEASPERPARLSTIRPVPSSDTSSSSPTQRGPGSRSRDDSPTTIRPRTSPSDLEQTPNVSRRRSRRTFSDSSVQSPPSIDNLRHIAFSAASHDQERSKSLAISEKTFPYHSSPNFIAYTPDSAGPSYRDPLRHATSTESIPSRLQYGPVARPGTGRSLANSTSWDSLEPGNTPPPLYIPKKRLRHKSGAESLKAQASASYGTETMADDDIDTLPFPKRPFSSHLSTIASESAESQSGNASQHLSHFSIGSGVLTGDDSSSLPLSPAGHRRHSSAPADSFTPSLGTRGTSSSGFQEEVGDMTLGSYREQSAVPQPLFKAETGPEGTRRYDGPLPPLPPMPKSRDSDENFDTLSALQTPPLRQKRSGYSIRQRSNSTPSHSRQQSQISYVESDRFSQGSSLFPTWARHFYTGLAVLPSKPSFASLSTASRQATGHGRNGSSWTERSITSQLGTGYASVEPSSPASSHFLPAIFRTLTRKKLGSQRDSRSSRIRRSGRSRPSQDRPSQDSMAINPATPAEGTEDVLPSGQPRWGTLKDHDDPPSPQNQGRRLVRKYSKQRQWDQMEFPRPMTKDRLSDFGVHAPRLAPSKRASQNRLSAWQAPSFVSSLDTLFTSRCNRQILFFALGFVCPLSWMLAAVLPLPKKPVSASEFEASLENSEEDVAMAMIKHEAGDAERRWREEKVFMKATWWRMLNRIMSVVGLLVIGAAIALAVIATR